MKQIAIRNREYRLSGRVGDPYFDNLTLADGTTDFLAHVCDHVLAPDSVVFDVGANIGLTSLLFSAVARNGRVYAFEPGGETYGHLTATVTENKLAHCVPLKLALGRETGEASFAENTQSGSASHLAMQGVSLGGSNARVAVMTLDDFVEKNAIGRLDLIKIDVEGFEKDVLDGASRTIATLRPDVFLEFNSFTLIAYGNLNPRQLLEKLLSDFAYVYRFENGTAVRIADDHAVLSFIHDNLIRRGCVDDLFCSSRPFPTTPMPVEKPAESGFKGAVMRIFNR